MRMAVRPRALAPALQSKECAIRADRRDILHGETNTLMHSRQIPRVLRRMAAPASGQEGAALVIVLIALVGLTAMAAAGVIVTGTDLTVTENADVATRAFLAAEHGLDSYLGSRADGSTSETYTTVEGTVTVTPTKLLDVEEGRILYRLRSVASFPQPRGGDVSRTVETLAIYSDGSIKVPASFTAASGFLKNGTAGTISGQDWAPSGDPNCPNSPQPPVAGVKVPPGEYTQLGGGTPVPDGDPPVDDAQTTLEMLAGIGIDWQAVVDGGMLNADYTIPPDSWPNYASLPADEWPVIYVDGNFAVSPSESGRGMLIVKGNLALNGTFQWEGAILTGGYISSNGYQTVQGATLSGLNEALGETVPSTDIGNGNKVFNYHSCFLKQASQAAFGGLSPVPGTWSEVF
jgi:hypothetical protein